MPLYEYYCVACDDKFEQKRSMSEATLTATCPQGHKGARKVLSTFAMVGTATAVAEGCANPAALEGMSACCGGGCAMPTGGHAH